MKSSILLVAATLFWVTGCASGTTDVPPDQLKLLKRCDPYKIASDEENFQPAQAVGRPPLVVSGHPRVGRSGVACILLTIDADGVVSDAEVAYTNNSAFARLALEAARKTPFEPARKNGVAVPSRLMFPLSFGVR